MSNLMLDVDQAGELKAAFRRANWTKELIKQLCESDLLAGLKKVLEGTAEIVVKSILSVVKKVTVAATEQKRTAECFVNKERYYYRDTQLDSVLPEIQEAQPEGQAIANQLNQNAKFVEMVQSMLGTSEMDLAILSRMAIEKKQVFNLAQIEVLIERQETGEDVGLLTNGWGNFLLVVNKEGSVSVVRADRGGRRWGVRLDPLGRGSVWDADDRFFSRN